MITIRNETQADYKQVEDMTRKAFWNLYVPGCMEHYLVHIMRDHQDFLPELDLVMELDQQIIGNMMYTKAKLIDEDGNEKSILTFGPISILPEYQRKGYGKKLMEYSFEKASALGYDAIVIFGNPANYVSRGFKSCKKYNICLEDGTFPAAMLVKELRPGALDGRKWVYHQSPVFDIDEKEAQRYDEGLEQLEKKYQPSQEEFYIHSHSLIFEFSIKYRKRGRFSKNGLFFYLSTGSFSPGGLFPCPQIFYGTLLHLYLRKVPVASFSQRGLSDQTRFDLLPHWDMAKADEVKAFPIQREKYRKIISFSGYFQPNGFSIYIRADGIIRNAIGHYTDGCCPAIVHHFQAAFDPMALITIQNKPRTIISVMRRHGYLRLNDAITLYLLVIDRSAVYHLSAIQRRKKVCLFPRCDRDAPLASLCPAFVDPLVHLISPSFSATQIFSHIESKTSGGSKPTGCFYL
jgi:putative acetyltransferase